MTQTATQLPAALSNARRMAARFPGTCCVCHQRFAAGTEILYAKPSVAHVTCPPVGAPVPARAFVAVEPLLAAAILARETLSAAIRDAEARLAPLVAAAHEAASAAGACLACDGAHYHWLYDTDYACVCTTEPGRTPGTSFARACHDHPEVAALDAPAEIVRQEIVGLRAKLSVEVRRVDRLTTPEKGDVVKVVKGRKVAKGTTGAVIWTGAGRSHYGQRAPNRIGLKDADGQVHWTSAGNVQVVEIEQAALRWF